MFHNIVYLMFQVVHNYGHAGAGISLFWGTSQEAANLAATTIEKHFSPPLSKL